jgi:plastocyanin
MKLNAPASALCIAVVALAVAGCGSSSKKSSSSSSSPPFASTAPNPGGGTTNANKPPSGGKSSNLQLAADSSGQLKFDKKSLSAKSGNVTITMDNPSPVQHAIAVEGSGIDKKGATVGMGSKSTVTVALKPGKYTFYCPVDGHRQAGMQGTLTVK